MGKSAKKSTKVEAVVATPPVKSAGKVKRGAEEIIEKVSVKKQKKNDGTVQAIEKLKSDIKTKKKPVKKESSSSEEESSDSEEEQKVAPAKAVKPAAKKPATNGTVKKDSSSDSSDDDSSSEEETKPKAKIVAPPAKKTESSSDDESDSSDSDNDKKAPLAVQAKKVAPKADTSSDDSSSDEEDDKKTAPAANKASVVAKKKDSSSEDDSDSDDSSDEDEKPKVAKVLVPAPKNGSVAVKKDSESSDSSDDDSESEEEKAPVAPKKKDSSDSSSEDESDDDVTPAKKSAAANGKDTKKSVAQKDSSSEEESSDDEDEDSSDDEDEKPSKALKKTDTDVEMVDAATPKTAKKQAVTESAKKAPQTPATPQGEGEGSKTLFVGNLPFSVEQADVENYFKEAAKVVEVRFSSDREGNFRGYGHVEFATAEDAQKAFALNGKELNGRALRLDMARERGAYTPGNERTPYQKPSASAQGKTLFVRGIDRSSGEDEVRAVLEKHFAPCGEITRVSIPPDRDNGGIKGFAYVDFTESEGLKKAMELGGPEFGGYTLNVDEAKPREGGSGGGRSFNGGGRGGRDGGGRRSGGDNYSGGRFGGRNSGGRGGDRGGRRGGRGRGGYDKPSLVGSGKKTTFDD